MESKYDLWNEQPLDLVKKKLTIASEVPTAMGVSDTRIPKVGSKALTSPGEVFLNEEDGTFYSTKTSEDQIKFSKEDKPKKFVLKVPTIKQEPAESDALSWQDSKSRTSGPCSSLEAKINFKNSFSVGHLNSKQSKPSIDGKGPKKMGMGNDLNCDKQEELSRFVLQSPNLYSALCLNKAKQETLQEDKRKPSTKPQLSETSPKDTSAMSAAYLEMFDKLMAEYVKKLNAQGSLDKMDKLENTVEGINLVLNNLAAYEQKLLSAMYMGSLLNSSFPNMYSAIPAVNPFLASQGLSPAFNPVFNSAFPLGFAPSSLLQQGLSPELLGCHSTPLSSSPYQNLVSSERTSSTSLSPKASSPASVSSSTTPSATATASMTCNKLNSQDPLLRVKDFQQWRPSNDTQSSTPTSSLTSLPTPTDLSSSNDESMSISMSAASSGRSSSVSSTQNLTLSPLSSVGASPPLSSKSDSYSRSQLLNFSRYL